ncbi:MAG: pantetheine-phosphate adenylyltransferase [Elusimicrobiota bacterium]
MARVAIYPGSFDPITNGHLDIIRRACRLFDRVIVVVAGDSPKRQTFSVRERVRMVKACVRDIRGADVDTFNGLIVEYLKSKKARVLIRGLRAVSDMDYEFQMASMNRHLFPEVETVFLMPDERYTHLSSSIIKEVARLGARVEDYMPRQVISAVRDKLGLKRR